MTPPERLSEAMRLRRLELGMKTWRDLAERADISYETLRAVRAGSNPSEGTADGIERALRWEPGSVRHVLTGGHPAPLGRPVERPSTEDDDDRLDRLYQEWKEDKERRPALEAFLESWRGRSAG